MALKVWLLVMPGVFGVGAVWGTGAGVSNHMFNSKKDCMVVARELQGVNAKCVYTTVYIRK
jgi:hypothetical protein